MKLSKVSAGQDGNTYVVIRSNDGKEWCTIKLSGFREVKMNEQGDALTIIDNIKEKVPYSKLLNYNKSSKS